MSTTADGATLRLAWPQWQSAGTSSVRALAPEFPFHPRQVIDLQHLLAGFPLLRGRAGRPQ